LARAEDARLTVPKAREIMTRRGAGSGAGFTLIELLLVMALIALILGVGVGLFTRLDLGDRVAVALVQDALRSAQNFAVARSAPARVRLDVARGTIVADGMLVVGTWHFESFPPEGAFGIDGAAQGGHLVDDGFQGKALSFAGEPARSHVEFPVQAEPSWNLHEGFQLRCALRPTPLRDGPGGGAVLALGETLGLETTAAGGVHAWFAPEVRDEDAASVRRGPRIPIEAPPETLVAGRWMVVDLQYDRLRFRLLVDGAEAASVEESSPVSRVDAPLVLSPGNRAWPGAIDDLSVSATAARDESRLPKNARFAAGTPAEIRFAPGGGLDRSVHRGPVDLAVEFEDGRRSSVVVSLFGTVE
jgi:prepilin-type N-terminal cleavage/methylation domain-containing protein